MGIPFLSVLSSIMLRTPGELESFPVTFWRMGEYLLICLRQKEEEWSVKIFAANNSCPRVPFLPKAKENKCRWISPKVNMLE